MRDKTRAMVMREIPMRPEPKASNPERAPQVASEMDQLRKAVVRCQESYARLEGDMDPVLRPPAPIGTEPCKEPIECLVPLAGEIRSQALLLNQLADRIAYAMERLEL